MSWYIVIGDTNEKVRVMELRVETERLDDVDEAAYLEWKGIEKLEDSKYSFFTSNVETKLLFQSNAREVLVNCITRITAYSSLQVVTTHEFDEHIKEQERKIQDWILWKAHKATLVVEDELEC